MPRGVQRQERQAFYYCYTRYRRCVTSHHARWLGSHATRNRRCLPFWTHPLESGAVVAVRAGCDTPKFTNVNFCSLGSHLAFYCLYRRGHSGGTSILFGRSYFSLPFLVTGVHGFKSEW